MHTHMRADGDVHINTNTRMYKITHTQDIYIYLYILSPVSIPLIF